ncbi:PREDICTED: DENN domain-containing protein 2A [Galeopterus variegatus]|uniref:DENN domain-containing protein 2A n=1 Tax=Galeopterus variegatus TaxID=482537 RepID=A0ABM0RBJ5_GALVR|nr:PREDICTED: DENN domain-containing protein 2A [Galeopterus variegatus]
MMTVCRPAEGSCSQTENLSDKLADKVKVEGPKAGEDPPRQLLRLSDSSLETDQESPFRRSPLESLSHLMLESRVDMFSSHGVVSGAAADLGATEASRARRKQLGGAQKPRPCALSIKDKIWEWEGKKELPAPAPGRRADAPEDCRASCVRDRTSGGDGVRTQLAEAKPGARLDAECLENGRNKGVVDVGGQDAERRRDPRPPARELEASVGRGWEPRLGRQRFPSDNLSVLKQVKKLEQALKDGLAGLDPQLPGTCYSPHCLPDKAEEGPALPENPGAGSGSEGSRRVPHLDLEGREPAPEAAGERKGSCGRPWDQSLESVYRGSEGSPPKPFINPLPKPRRTFKHAGEGDKDGHPGIGFRREKRNLPPLPSLPPPPLPSSPPPSSVNRRLWNGRQKSSADHRKSYEFEDLLQSSSENSRVDWYAQTKLGLTRTLSEENVYEDILDPPMKENPYEDIELHGRCLGKKCVLTFPGSPTSSIPDTPTKQSLSKPAFFRQNSERRNFKLLDTRKLSRDGTGSPSKTSPPSTPSSPDDTFFNLGDPQNGRKKRKIPKVMLATSFMFRHALSVLCKDRLKKSPGREQITGPSSACVVTDQVGTVEPAGWDIWTFVLIIIVVL